MTTTNTTSLSDVLLFLGDFKRKDDTSFNAADLCDIGDNVRYLYTPSPRKNTRKNTNSSPAWLGDLPEDIPQPIFCLRFSQPPDDSDGWVFGSSSEKHACHFRLANDNQSGISRRYFSIDIISRPNYQSVAKLKLLSGRLKMSTRSGKDVLLTTRGDGRELTEPFMIQCKELSFRVWSPRLTPQEKVRFAKNVEGFHQHALTLLPTYFPPINSGQSTRLNSGQSTRNDNGDIRIGMELRLNEERQLEPQVYVRDTKTRYQNGGYGSVFKVLRQGTDKVFGAKELHWLGLDNSGTLRYQTERLESEYNRIKELTHPHIVEAIDFARSDDPTQRPWLVMEYIPRTLLDLYIEQASDVSLPAITAQILSALVLIHQHGMIHGDIKPGNILMERSNDHWVAKLADFGDARHVKHTAYLAGSPFFIAPEKLQQPYQCDGKSDMFSLGVVFITLLAGSSVWEPKTRRYRKEWTPDLQRKFMQKSVLPLIENVGRDFLPLLYGLLCRDPRNRWSAFKSLNWITDYIKTNGRQEGNAQSCCVSRKRKRVLSPRSSWSADSNASTIRLPKHDLLLPVETGGTQHYELLPPKRCDEDEETSNATLKKQAPSVTEAASLRTREMCPSPSSRPSQVESLPLKRSDEDEETSNATLKKQAPSVTEAAYLRTREMCPSPSSRPIKVESPPSTPSDRATPPLSVATPFSQDDDDGGHWHDDDYEKDDKDYTFNSTDWFDAVFEGLESVSRAHGYNLRRRE